MFATRRDQENLTHLHHQAASVKPLNQANSKTPGPIANAPKTPFRNRNDENAAINVVKTGGGKAFQKDLFATPAATKPRAVLGAKTTNARAQATPGQGLLKTTNKPTAAPPPSAQKISPRLRRGKVRIHQTPVEASPIALASDGEDSAPEVEYCPPPSIRTPPLPDEPDDFHEWFEANKSAMEPSKLGWDYPNAIDEDRDENGHTAGDRKLFADVAAMQKKAVEEESVSEHLRLEQPETQAWRTQEVLRAKASRQASATTDSEKNARQRSTLGTVNPRNAAAVLSGVNPPPESNKKVPGFAAPTQATRSRAEAVLGAGKENDGSRFMNAKAASRTTMGYAKGRQVSATKRPPLSAAHRTPVLKEVRDGSRPKAVEAVRPHTTVTSEVDGAGDEGVRQLDDEFTKFAMEDFVLEL